MTKTYALMWQFDNPLTQSGISRSLYHDHEEAINATYAKTQDYFTEEYGGYDHKKTDEHYDKNHNLIGYDMYDLGDEDQDDEDRHDFIGRVIIKPVNIPDDLHHPYVLSVTKNLNYNWTDPELVNLILPKIFKDYDDMKAYAENIANYEKTIASANGDDVEIKINKPYDPDKILPEEYYDITVTNKDTNRLITKLNFQHCTVL